MANTKHCVCEVEGGTPEKRTVKRETNGKTHREQSTNRNPMTPEE